jgi:starch synthase (maltosyl-transferring)
VTSPIIIDEVRPRTPRGLYPAKTVVGYPTRVRADIYRDGHEILAGRFRWRPSGTRVWNDVLLEPLPNDAWEGAFVVDELGIYEFVVEAWTDHVATWRKDIAAKLDAGQDVELELREGADLLEAHAPRVDPEHRPLVAAAVRALGDATQPVHDRVALATSAEVAAALAPVVGSDVTTSARYRVRAERMRALVGAWYELFPRSYGGFVGAAERLDAVAGMGFDVVYLPPIHPIGTSFRKGRDNSLTAEAGDPGSPWAIGSPDGGHDAIHPDLGSEADFTAFVERANGLGMEVALDYALQCSADHPWVTEHPEWFHHRVDGSIRYAENPPKKYQDIYPINFFPDDDNDRAALWSACEQIFEHWIAFGIRIFRVDNPHTKPFAFWEWVLPAVQARHPDVLFLAEAFTRPKPMAKLAEIGFSQSYTYFTWRTFKDELIEYLEEVALGPKADYMRPNFWPNTPDILSGPLRNGGPGAFKQRLVLAATTAPSYGIYSGYELCENEPFSDVNEEYIHSEKYEIKHRDFDTPTSLAGFITRINDIRRRHPALQQLDNIAFHHSNNEWILAYSKHTPDLADVVLVVVNLDPFTSHEDTLDIDLVTLGLPLDAAYEAHDELTGATYVWQGANPYIRLEPDEPAHVFHLRAMA